MKGKIVLDVVFKGRSLNYDQGMGNLQELKKVVLPNGKTHTLVSKYALRYSLLDTMDGFADGKLLTKGGDSNKATIQPDPNALLDGSLFDAPEFVLFGFLLATKVGGKSIQVQRENPTKITHAISLTPFEGDLLMYGNHGFANRYAKAHGLANLDINLFNKEEHEALYAYSIVMDLDYMKEVEFVTDKEINLEKLKQASMVKDAQMDKLEKGYLVRIFLDEEKLKDYVRRFLEAVFSLKRSHQGELKDLQPIVVIAQYVPEGSYNTYLDKIGVESGYEEEVEVKTEGDKTRAIHRKLSYALLKVPKVGEKRNENGIIQALLKGEKGTYRFEREAEGVKIQEQ